MCIRNIHSIALTDKAVEFCEQFGMPVMARDFLGYLIQVTDKENCLVGLDNTLIPMSADNKHPKMTKRRASKVFKIMADTGFIKYQGLDPFPEMERYNNMKMDYEHAYKIDDEILGRIDNNMDFDDDIDNIEEYVGNLFS